MGFMDKFNKWTMRQQLQVAFVITSFLLVGILILITRLQLDWLKNQMLDRSDTVVVDSLRDQMRDLGREKAAFIERELENTMNFVQVLRDIDMILLGFSSYTKAPIVAGSPVWNYDIPASQIVDINGTSYTYETGVFLSKYSSDMSTEGTALMKSQAAMDKIFPHIFREEYAATYFGYEIDELFHYYPGYKSSDQSYTPLVREWYYKAANKTDGSVIITEPYTDSSSGVWMITSSCALIVNSSVYGVAGADLSLAYLSTEINNVVILDSGFMMLVSSEGMIICMPDSWSYLGTSIRIYDETKTGISLNTWNSLISGADDEFQTFYDINGTEYYTIVTPVVPEGFTKASHYLLTCVYRTEARDPITNMRDKYDTTYWTIFWIVIAIAIITFFIIVVLIYFVTRKVSSQLKEIERVFTKLTHRGLFPDITKGINLEKIEKAESSMPGLVQACIQKIDSIQKKEESFYFFEWGSTRPSDELIFEDWCSKIYPFNLYHDKDMSWRAAIPNLTKVVANKPTNK